MVDADDTIFPEYIFWQVLSDFTEEDEDKGFKFAFANRNSFINNHDCCSFTLEHKFNKNIKHAVLFFSIF